VPELIGTIYLQAGTLTNTSTAYVLVERSFGGQTPDNNTAINGGVYIAGPHDIPVTVATLYLSTDELVNSGHAIEGPTTDFVGTGVVGTNGWYKVYAIAQGSKDGSNVTNGCTATVYGLNLIYT